MKQISNFKKLAMFVLGIILSMNTVAQTWPPAGINGNGLTDSTAWEITTPEQLAVLSYYTNATNITIGKYFKLMNDIDLSGYSAGTGWTPIGSSSPFKGHFNGNGHVVRNLTINLPSHDYVGLFRTATSDATIKNLGVENCNIIGQYLVGGLVGQITWGTITNCYVTGSVSGISVGGLVDDSQYSTITNCYTNVNVSAENNAGGLVNGNSYSLITDCFSTGNVSGRGNVGGLAGFNLGNYDSYVSIITNCYATGNVSAQAGTVYPAVNVGGLVGKNSESAIIRNCYATGDVNVTGTSKRIGGLVGANENSATIINSYAIGNVTGEETIGGLSGNNIVGSTIKNCYAVGKVSGTQYIGGLVGYSNSITKNCVAANDSIKLTSTSVDINRVTGYAGGTLQNNYANTNMVVMQNGTQVTPTDGTPASGTGKSMGTLESVSFYTTDTLWNLVIWDFTYTWNICDGERLPFLRWQDIDCGAVIPVTNIIGVPTNVMINDSVGLTVTVLPYNATNTSIVWSVNNSDTTGASITDGNIFNATTAGTAIITATIIDGIAPGTPYTQDFNIIVGTVGVVEIATREISVFPNPTSHELRIKSGELKIEKVKIYDILGRNFISQSSFQSQEITIDISQLPRGIYFVKIETELGEVVKKVIKE